MCIEYGNVSDFSYGNTTTCSILTSLPVSKREYPDYDCLGECFHVPFIHEFIEVLRYMTPAITTSQGRNLHRLYGIMGINPVVRDESYSSTLYSSVIIALP